MAIRYEMTPVSLFGQLGRLAGQAQAAREQQQQIAQQTSQIRQMQHQTAMAEFQAKLDLQAEMRARQWELQKAEINSQYSLQEQLRTETMYRDRDTRKRIEREDNAEKALKELNRLWGDRESLTPANRAVYDSIESKIIAEKYGFDINIPMPQRAAAPTALEQLSAFLKPGAIGVPETVSEQKIDVISPDGIAGKIPLSVWPMYEGLGYKKVGFPIKKEKPAWQMEIPIEGYGVPFGATGVI